MASLLDLIKNDEGIQKLLSNIKGLGKGAARGLTTDTVGAPVDLVSGALSSLGVPVGSSPIGGSSWLRSVLDQPIEDSPSELAGNLLSSVVSPGKAAADVATLAPLLLGAIRPGGRPDLALMHDIPLSSSSLDWLASGKDMSNPSIAIAKRMQPFGGQNSPSLLFNPNSHYFDPAFNPNNKLYNRDAYTSRSKGYSKADKERRTVGTDLRFQEGFNPGLGQAMAIHMSPEFRSFAQYEKSKSGARTLDKARDPSFESEVEDMLRSYRGKQLSENDQRLDSDIFNHVLLKGRIQQEAEKGLDPFATTLLDTLQTMPSDYAELKRFGNLPINERTVRAMVIPSELKGRGKDTFYGKESSTFDDFKRAANSRGIKAGTPFDLLPDAMKGDIQYEANNLLRALAKDGADEFSFRYYRDHPAFSSYVKDYEFAPWQLHNLVENIGAPDIDSKVIDAMAESTPMKTKLMNWLTRE